MRAPKLPGLASTPAAFLLGIAGVFRDVEKSRAVGALLISGLTGMVFLLLFLAQ